MYYVFTNSGKLQELCSKGDFSELVEEFKKSDMVMLSNYEGINISAKETYRNMCLAIVKNGGAEDFLKDISECGIKLFSEKEDVDALIMIQADPNLFGKLDEVATAIIDEYRDYKELALKVFAARPRTPSFETNVNGIKIKFAARRLTFEKNGRVHVVFRE